MESWPRPRWIPGGRPAFLIYVVYGAFPTPPRLQVSRSRHHTNGPAPGMRVSLVAGEWLRNWCVGPFGNLLDEHADGLAPAVRGATNAILITGDLEDRDTADELRDTLGLASAFLDSGGAAVLDPQALRWWSPREWRAAFVDREGFRWLDHVVLIQSDDWLHTRGMRKFGRPDLSIRGGASDARVLERLGEFQAEGGVIDPAGVIEGLRVVPHLEESELENPDFNNVWLEFERAS